ncbi:UNVERIFIED_ORG: hypothetical protein GGD48_005867 [Rhizobium etli]|nr:hypothetical protein [Rhizobium sophoriradicis]
MDNLGRATAAARRSARDPQPDEEQPEDRVEGETFDDGTTWSDGSACK